MPTEPQPDPPWTIIKLLQWTAAYFKERIQDNPRLEAEILLAHALGCSRLDLYLRHDQPLNEVELSHYRQLVRRRARREPMAYILGYKEFWSLQLAVTPAVLIPRPDTECLVEMALQTLQGRGFDFRQRVLELGTGSGAICIALAKERPATSFVATDLDPAAISVAMRNAQQHEVDHQIFFLVGQWLRPIRESAQFDLIISNPPYIPTNEIAVLAPEIHEYEPHTALDGGIDGMAAIHQIIAAAPSILKSAGYLILEMGHDQQAVVEAAGADNPAYDEIAFKKDDAGHYRVVRLRKRRQP